MRLSIITINYNNKEGLIKTLNSVFSQTSFDDYEYIVIDGGSSDGSETILKNSKGIDYWVSEPDDGIYNAMNKGIKVAQGDYCLFLNSGDILYNKTVLEDVFKHKLTEDFVVGNHVSNNKIIKAPLHITAFDLFYNTLCHQSVFIKTKLLKEDPYDEHLRLVSDWKHMFVWLVLKNATYKYLNIVICNYDNTGISNKLWQLLAQEREQAKKALLPKRIYEDYSLLTVQKELQVYNPELYEAVKIVNPKGIDNKIILAIISIKKIIATFLSKIK